MPITIFDETFTGTGAIAGTTPATTPFGAAVWQSYAAPNDLVKSGGYAVAGTPGDRGIAWIGDELVDYSGARQGSLTFAFTTGPNVISAPSDGEYALEIAIRLDDADAQHTFNLYYSIGGVSGDGWYVNLGSPVLASGIAANTNYTGTFVFADGEQTLSVLGLTLTDTVAYPAPASLRYVLASAGDTHKIDSVSMTVATPATVLNAPMATAKAYGGGRASISTPVQTAKAYGGSRFQLLPPVQTLSAVATYTAPENSMFAPIQTIVAYGGGVVNLLPPSPTIYSTGHDSYGENDFTYQAPMQTLSASGGANAAATAPSATLVSTATGTNWITAAITAPMATVAADGVVSAVATTALTAPIPNLVGYGGAVCSISLGSSPTITAAGLSGSVASVALTCPLFDLTASASPQNYGGALLTAPMGRLAPTLRAYIIAPMATLTAIGTAVVTATYEAYALNLKHSDDKATDELTRYTNFPFTHVVRYQNSYFGANSTGLYLLEGTTDDTVAIPFAVQTAQTDFGAPEKKTISSAYFGGRIGAAETISLVAGEAAPVTYAYTTPRDALAQNHRQAFGRGIKERYYALAVSGSAEFELDTLDLNVEQLTRRI